MQVIMYVGFILWFIAGYYVGKKRGAKKVYKDVSNIIKGNFPSDIETTQNGNITTYRFVGKSGAEINGYTKQ